MTIVGVGMEEVVAGLRRVATGLLLVWLGLVVMVLNGLAGVGVMVAFLELKGDPAAMLHALQRDHAGLVMVLTALNVLAQLLTFSGKVYCLAVPETSAATPKALMATIANGLGMVLGFAAQMPELAEYGEDFYGAGLVFGIFGYIFFLQFLGQLAKFVGSIRMRMRTRKVLVGSASVLGIALLTMVGASMGAGGPVTLVTGLIACLGGLFVFGMYMMLVNDMKRLCGNAASAVEEREELVDV